MKKGLILFAFVLILFLDFALAQTSISTCADLNNTIRNNLAGDYILDRNIDCSDTITWNGGAGFEPIGDGGNSFTGDLDGQGFTISDLYISRDTEDNVGLFGYVDEGVIRNLVFENLLVRGGSYTGGLIGYNNYGNVSNLSLAVNLVGGSGSNVGGLIGFNNYGNIYNSNLTGSVHGDGSYTGGLIGFNNYGEVLNSHSGVMVVGVFDVGGLIGRLSHVIVLNSSSTGNVQGSNNNVGGLVGFFHEGDIMNCHATGNVIGVPIHVGGLIG